MKIQDVLDAYLSAQIKTTFQSLPTDQEELLDALSELEDTSANKLMGCHFKVLRRLKAKSFDVDKNIPSYCISVGNQAGFYKLTFNQVLDVGKTYQLFQMGVWSINGKDIPARYALDLSNVKLDAGYPQLDELAGLSAEVITALDWFVSSIEQVAETQKALVVKKLKELTEREKYTVLFFLQGTIDKFSNEPQELALVMSPTGSLGLLHLQNATLKYLNVGDVFEPFYTGELFKGYPVWKFNLVRSIETSNDVEADTELDEVNFN